MPLSREEVQHLATLCRIGMTEDDLENMPDELSSILEMFQVLQEVDTAGVPPTGHSVSLESVMRADDPGDSSSRDEVLSNAPRTEGDLFRVNPGSGGVAAGTRLCVILPQRHIEGIPRVLMNSLCLRVSVADLY